MDAFDCMATDCGPPTLTATSLRVQGGDDVDGEEGLQTLGLLTISGTDGTVVVQAGLPGGYTAFSFDRFQICISTQSSRPASADRERSESAEGIHGRLDHEEWTAKGATSPEMPAAA